MTYDPYEAKETKETKHAKDARDAGATRNGGDDRQERDKDRRTTADKVERALRSERGSKPATPVVPLSESDPAAAGVGRDTGSRPARPTTPPPVPPPVTPSAAPPATPPKAAPATAARPEKDPFAVPVQDPVHEMEARDTRTDSTPARETAPGRTPESAPAQTPRLIPQDECDKLNLRLQEALSTFIDGPRRSVEEAADVLEETAKRLTTALAERPRHLRDSWDAGGGKNGASTADTEDLRLALRSYREVTERLLRI
ncbi:hypothetical protein ABZ353_17535 [Streptomyces niveus]|uniref:hypothetical protein n=1 Tax=Streptomyces niveus TaxID=193462 RepID=UPI0033FC9A2F